MTIALVSNSQMTDAQKLSSEFEKENPGTKLKFISLSENQARAKITMSTAMGGSEFDVVMISNFETPQWAKDGWLVNLSDYAKNTPGYDENDFIPSLRESLSYEGNMYSVPFYGESSFLMYRKDLFEQAGIKVNQDPNYQPTWQEVAAVGEDHQGEEGRRRGDLPARQAGLGRGARAAGHGDQHVRRTLVRRPVERPTQQPGGQEGRQLLRRPDQRIRRTRRVLNRFPGVRQPVRSGPDGDVVRRDVGGLGPRGSQDVPRSASARSATCPRRSPRSPTRVGSTPGRWAFPRAPRTPTAHGSSSRG